MNEQEKQDKGRLVWIEANRHVCANISASVDHPFWLPIAIKVSREEFDRVTSTTAFRELYFSLGLACVWGTPTSRERAAKTLGRHFEHPYQRPVTRAPLDAEFRGRSAA